MEIKIGELDLIKQIIDTETSSIKQFRGVKNIKIIKKRRIVEQKVLGMDGSVLQDLGRDLIRITLEGAVRGEGSENFIVELWKMFKEGEPVRFETDIATISDITKVLINDFSVDDVGGKVKNFRYMLDLIEYIPPPQKEKEEEKEDQSNEAKDEAKKEADEAANSNNVITGKVVDENGDPIAGVKVKISWDEGEYVVETDDEGVYKKENVPPGNYTIIPDVPDAEKLKKEIRVGEKESKE